MSQHDPTARIGTVIDRYRIDALLGAGGFGAVYRATHTLMGRSVALKLLHGGEDLSAEMQQRFLREAQAAAAIGHPGIVQVYDCGLSPQGEPFLAMELLQGEDLQERLERQGPMAWPAALQLIANILDALAAAHRAGVVHRDLKPANIFLAKDPTGAGEQIKLLDFGISKFERGGVSNLTRTGVVMGTPHYMAPESFMGSSTLDGRADLYAVAAILYEAISGEPPHDEESYEKLVVRIATQPAPSARTLRPAVPEFLADIIDRGLERDPEVRWQDAVAFRRALLHQHSQASLPVSPPGPQSLPFDATAMAASTPALTPPHAMATPAQASPHGEALSHQALPTPNTMIPSHAPAGMGEQETSHVQASMRRGWLAVGSAILLLGLLLSVAYIFLQPPKGGEAGQVAQRTAPTTLPSPPIAPREEQKLEPEAPVAFHTIPPQANQAPTEVTDEGAQNVEQPGEEGTAENTGAVDPAANGLPSVPVQPLPPATPTADLQMELSIIIAQALSVPGADAHDYIDRLLESPRRILRCRESERQRVFIQILRGPDGELAIVQPHASLASSSVEAARCVSSALQGTGPLGSEAGGILTLQVNLPPR